MMTPESGEQVAIAHCWPLLAVAGHAWPWLAMAGHGWAWLAMIFRCWPHGWPLTTWQHINLLSKLFKNAHFRSNPIQKRQFVNKTVQKLAQL